MHGGISPELDTLKDVERVRIQWESLFPELTPCQVNRFEEPASKGLLCDLLWADPIPNFGHEVCHITFR